MPSPSMIQSIRSRSSRSEQPQPQRQLRRQSLSARRRPGHLHQQLQRPLTRYLPLLQGPRLSAWLNTTSGAGRIRRRSGVVSYSPGRMSSRACSKATRSRTLHPRLPGHLKRIPFGGTSCAGNRTSPSNSSHETLTPSFLGGVSPFRCHQAMPPRPIPRCRASPLRC